MTAETCPWCGHPKCSGETPSPDHHRLCCLDGPRRPCWGTRTHLPLIDATPEPEGEAA